MISLFISSTVILIMIVWFKTDGVIEWIDLFGWNDFFKTTEYRNEKINTIPNILTYPNFLKNKYNNFLTRLISCQICLSIWSVVCMSVGSSVFLLEITPIFYIPITWVLTIILYGIIIKLLNYENK